MPEPKTFTVEKLSWYLSKDLRHDPRVKLETLVRFLQDHGLATRTLLGPDATLQDDFCLQSNDLSALGLEFMRSGYQKWARLVDRGGDPRDATLLQREFEKLVE